jgi:hypothetical protein
MADAIAETSAPEQTPKDSTAKITHQIRKNPCNNCKRTVMAVIMFVAAYATI